MKKGDIIPVPGKNTKAQVVKLELKGKKHIVTVMLHDGERFKFEA